MKIEIMGYSGSGKSTLCRELAERYQLPALHLDQVQFLPNWEIRPEEEKMEQVAAFLDENPKGWVIDGNYSKLIYERRNEEADRIFSGASGGSGNIGGKAARIWRRAAAKSWIGSLSGGSFGKDGPKRSGKGTGRSGSSIRRR